MDNWDTHTHTHTMSNVASFPDRWYHKADRLENKWRLRDRTLCPSSIPPAQGCNGSGVRGTYRHDWFLTILLACCLLLSTLRSAHYVFKPWRSSSAEALLDLLSIPMLLFPTVFDVFNAKKVTHMILHHTYGTKTPAKALELWNWS